MKESANKEAHGGGGEAVRTFEGATQGADKEDGAKSPRGLDGGEGCRGHAVLVPWGRDGG